jgi:hypothetical protein
MQAEAQAGAAREAARAAALRNGPAPDFDAEEDAATLKARAWDDWKARSTHTHTHARSQAMLTIAEGALKTCFCFNRQSSPIAQDDHPFGYGNSKRRPCG